MAHEDGSGGEVKERVGMGKRYERYRKEYSSRQVGFLTAPLPRVHLTVDIRAIACTED